MKKLDHQRSERHFFHNLGIWDKEAVNDRGWKLNSLTGIISNLGHENVRPIFNMHT